MRYLLALVLLLIGGGSANVTAQEQRVDMEVSCYPMGAFHTAMQTHGFKPVMHGAFDDGDLFLLYENAEGNFITGFASAKGFVCLVGQGSGLEKPAPIVPGVDG